MFQERFLSYNDFAEDTPEPEPALDYASGGGFGVVDGVDAPALAEPIE